ncbi:hypothetical protein [Streptomyces daghestanicus]|uniref:Integral membrane protein n=1 Tax=Streptomyces daghestanicus TaxID=66885 RepID=A0ABQ3Q4I3_9ACTN|nr:hypothetical protein [Streptomyces daghestanicus]GGU20089.1 hypothetical protein GCM10010259_08250 [Streptomyces daghestanicus]GHI32197.1 hypothetical protein Sdagh_39270 [Streptomyces daghestanicus]
MSTPAPRTSVRKPAAPSVPLRRPDRDRGGGPSSHPARRALLDMQSAAGNRAVTAAVQRARATAEGTAQEQGAPPDTTTAPGNTTATAETAAAENTTAAPQDDTATARKKTSARDRVTAVFDRTKKNAETIDTWIKAVHVPVNAGVSQEAAATANEGLKHSAAASGTGAASGNLFTELANTGLSALDASAAKADARKHGKGAAFHRADKKADTKTADAAVGAVSSTSYGFALVKELFKAEKFTQAATMAEASGITSGVSGAVKSGRALSRIALTTRKYRDLRQLDLPARSDDQELSRLKQARDTAVRTAAEASLAVELHWRHEGDGQVERVLAAMEAAEKANHAVGEAIRAVRAAYDANTLHTVHDYALGKQHNKLGKQALTALGEGTKVAGGVVTAVAATAGGAALASNPVGWGLAGGAALVVGSVTGWRAGRAGVKRYNAVRHPHDYVDPGEVPAKPVSRKEAWKEAVHFTKKVVNGERDLMARRLYRLAAGPDIPGSGATEDHIREAAREFLVALKAGPDNQKLSPDEWRTSLNNPEKTADWIKEIAEQLSSA